MVYQENQSERITITNTDPDNAPLLYHWAFIHDDKYDQLAALALEEKWYYGNSVGKSGKNHPLLRNYLNYTFKRLWYEQKILITDEVEDNTGKKTRYAAFNTGLVDRMYSDIYALLKKNPKEGKQPWLLSKFVVAGENAGKIFIRYFDKNPERADYFENRIENMLFDPKGMEPSCDYEHMLTEHLGRFPKEFLEDNCFPASFLTIDGVTLDMACAPGVDKEVSEKYFGSLGTKVKNDTRTFRRMKNRLEDAVALAVKRVSWNYKTAIPMYSFTKNAGCLLLPLSLVEEDGKADLAVVMSKQPSGRYQGETVLTLEQAYLNSRLVSRPDSDWLRTEFIRPGLGYDIE